MPPTIRLRVIPGPTGRSHPDPAPGITSNPRPGFDRDAGADQAGPGPGARGPDPVPGPDPVARTGRCQGAAERARRAN
ncbi:hypothetical protein GCM10023322_15690 [Rugosimonospora acidiphila]|uniref:Uncharacterized protein n=1 Tax=Rugosimonospora acidiphila TaxID=556531 RepID=A0ABP9RNE5_9ACTN